MNPSLRKRGHLGCVLCLLFSVACFLLIFSGGTVLTVLKPSILPICNGFIFNTGGATVVPLDASSFDSHSGTVVLPQQFSLEYSNYKWGKSVSWEICVRNNIYTILESCANDIPGSLRFCIPSNVPPPFYCLPASYSNSKFGISLWDSSDYSLYYYIFDMEHVFQYHHYSYDNSSTLNDIWYQSYSCEGLSIIAIVCGSLILFCDCCCCGTLWCLCIMYWVRKWKKQKRNPNFFVNYHRLDNSLAPPPTQDLPPNSELIAGNGVPVPKPGPPVGTPPHKNNPGLGPAVSNLLSGRWLNRNHPPTPGGVVYIPGPSPPVLPRVDNPASGNRSHFPGVAIQDRPHSNDHESTPDVEQFSVSPSRTPQRLPTTVEVHPVPPSSTHLDLPSLKHCIVPMVAAKWESFGIFLGVEHACLQKVKRDYRMDCERACEEMLKLWFAKDTGTGDRPRTWATVIDALEEEGYRAQAQALRDRLLK